MRRLVRLIFNRWLLLIIALLLWVVGLVLNMERWWFGAIVWAMVSGYGMYFLMARISAPHTLPIEWTREARAGARRAVGGFISGRKLFLATIREGQPPKRPDGKSYDKMPGPGVVLVDSTSAVLLASEVRPTRLLEGGVHFLEQHEQILAVVDLRSQVRSKNVFAQTRDGIEVICKVAIRFQIDGTDTQTMADLSASPTPWPLPYRWTSARRILNATDAGSVGVDGAAGRRWDEVPLDLTEKHLLTQVAGYSLDRLTEPRNPALDPRQTIRNQLEADLRQALAARGIRLIGLKLGPFVPKDEKVREQRIHAWQAEWNRRKKVLEAQGEAESRRKLELARAQAQMDTMTRIIEALDASYRAGASNADLIALRFLEVVEGLAKNPEAHATLEQVRRRLLMGRPDV